MLARPFINIYDWHEVANACVRGNRDDPVARNISSRLNETEGIFCQKIPLRCMRPDPAPATAELAMAAHTAPSPEPGLFVTEPGKYRIFPVGPEPAEWPVPDISHEKFRSPGKLAGIHISPGVNICHTGAGAASALQ